jgi:hypothetical protein
MAAAVRRNRVVGHANVDPKTLMAHSQNWRLHPEHQQAILRGALDEIGWAKSVQVQKGSNVIVDGHARVMIAVRDGDKVVPVEFVDLTDEEVKAALAAFDSITGMADHDYQALSNLLGGFSAKSTGMTTLKDELEAEAADALAMAAQYVGRDKTNFHSVQKAVADRKVSLKAVFTLDEAEDFELALEATGKINRAEAIGEVVQFYLRAKGKLNDSHPTAKLDGDAQDSVAAALAGAARDQPAPRARNARRKG